MDVSSSTMPRTRFTILHAGRGPRRAALSEIFKNAGYSVSPARPSRPDDRARLFAVDVTSGAGPSAATRMSLRTLRERAGRTQGEMARRLSMAQPQLSRVEARRDHLTSTLRRYVRALGGRIEVIAVVKGRRIVLRGV